MLVAGRAKVSWRRFTHFQTVVVTSSFLADVQKHIEKSLTSINLTSMTAYVFFRGIQVNAIKELVPIKSFLKIQQDFFFFFYKKGFP